MVSVFDGFPHIILYQKSAMTLKGASWAVDLERLLGGQLAGLCTLLTAHRLPALPLGASGHRIRFAEFEQSVGDLRAHSSPAAFWSFNTQCSAFATITRPKNLRRY